MTTAATTIKPLVNLDFANALRAAAEQAGHAALVSTVDAAILRNVDAADHVGAIMHGATWTACSACGGGGKRGRKRCSACKGCGEDATFAERVVVPIRAAAFAALGM